jgi:hypothetical protein
MTRTNLIGLGMLAVALVLMPSRTSADDTTKPGPTSQSASAPDNSAEGDLQFNSKLALQVWVLDENGGPC